MPAEDTKTPTLWGPVNQHSRKTELNEITAALGIYDSKNSRNNMVKKIKRHLEQNPELAMQKCFQGLFSYRKAQEAKSSTPKSSEDKGAEDELEGSKTTKQATGYVSSASTDVR